MSKPTVNTQIKSQQVSNFSLNSLAWINYWFKSITPPCREDPVHLVSLLLPKQWNWGWSNNWRGRPVFLASYVFSKDVARWTEEEHCKTGNQTIKRLCPRKWTNSANLMSHVNNTSYPKPYFGPIYCNNLILSSFWNK